MAINVFILDENRDWFLQQGRIDPMTRAQYKRGDRVVVCNSCHMVSLESTWNDCGGCTSPGCGCKVAARKFLKAPAPKNNVPSTALNQIVLRNGRVDRQYTYSRMRASGTSGFRLPSIISGAPSS